MAWEHYCKQLNVCIQKELTESSAHKICENFISTIIIDTVQRKLRAMAPGFLNVYIIA